MANKSQEQFAELVAQKVEARLLTKIPEIVAQTLKAMTSAEPITTFAKAKSVGLTTKEAMEVLGVCRKTLYSIAQKYPCIRIGGDYSHQGYIYDELINV